MSQISEIMKNAVLQAAKKAKVNRESILAGRYKLDHLVHVKGFLTVGEEYEQTNPQELKPWLLFRVALSKLNETTQNNLLNEVLEAYKAEVIREAEKAEKGKVAGPDDEEEDDTLTKQLKAEVKLKCKSLLAATSKTYNGKTTYAGEIKVLDDVELADDVTIEAGETGKVVLEKPVKPAKKVKATAN